MTVASSSRSLAGDAGASKLTGPLLNSDPPSPRSPLSECRVVGGSRFWALAKKSSDEEDIGVGDLAEAECQSPRSGPAVVKLVDFLSPAWQLVG
jgi:hypothetical protein